MRGRPLLRKSRHSSGACGGTCEAKLLIWDGAGFHHSHWLNAWIKGQRHWLRVKRLPPYAPELNPVEGVWAWIKGSQIPNFCPDSIEPVLDRIGLAARKLESQPALLMAFLKKTGLSL